MTPDTHRAKPQREAECPGPPPARLGLPGLTGWLVRISLSPGWRVGIIALTGGPLGAAPVLDGGT